MIGRGRIGTAEEVTLTFCVYLGSEDYKVKVNIS